MGKNRNGKDLGKGIRQRKDGRYEARVTVNGRTISLYDTNLRNLRKKFDAKKKELKTDINISYQNITLNEWFDEWMKKYKEPILKSSSIFVMKSKFNNTFGRLLGSKKVKEIRNLDIQSAILTLTEEKRAASSIRDAFGRVRECFEVAKNNRLIMDNPCYNTSLPKNVDKGTKRFLSQEEQKIFLETVGDSWYKEMFYIMFHTGMRIGEVGGLRWCDVDFENECIHIKKSLSCNYENGEKKIFLTSPKTYNSYRDIPFFCKVKEMFLSQKEKQDKLKVRLGNRYRCRNEYQNLVFVTSMGSPVLRYHAESECKKIVKRINEERIFDAQRNQKELQLFEHVYPHAIRHTFCSRCFEFDMEPKVVQQIMGHGNYSTTIEIYTHITKPKYESEISKFRNIS